MSQLDYKAEIPVNDAMAMVRVLAKTIAARANTPIGENIPKLRPTSDLSAIVAPASVFITAEQREALQNYVLAANIAYLLLKRQYRITH